MNTRFNTVFNNKKPIIGMVHLKALPGSPDYHESLNDIYNFALKDVDTLVEGGVNAVQVENQFDTPYLLPEKIGPETVATISTIAYKIKSEFPEIPLGINIHMNCAIEALAIAKAVGAQFIRCFNLMNAYISNSGYVSAMAPQLMRYKRSIFADDIMIFGDFQVKHGSHAITADRTLEEKAADIQKAMAEGAILTGISTGIAPDSESVIRVKKAIDIPLLIGSGLSLENCNELWPLVDGAIIGSGFKQNGDLKLPVDKTMVSAFMNSIK